jgi:tetratricopeptide (TPR) repeat protein
MKSPSSMELSSQLYQAGREAMEQRQFDDAVVLLRSSAELCPHFKTLELLGECLLELPGRSSEATLFLAAAAGLGNKSARSFFLLARALSLQGNIQAAIEKLDIAIEIQPQYRAAIQLRDELQNRTHAAPEEGE